MTFHVFRRNSLDRGRTDALLFSFVNAAIFMNPVLALRTTLGTLLTVLERRHVGDGFVDIANVLSRLCKDYGKTVRFILFVGSYFAYNIWSTFIYSTLKSFKNTDLLVCFTIIFPISKLEK